MSCFGFKSSVQQTIELQAPKLKSRRLIRDLVHTWQEILAFRFVLATLLDSLIGRILNKGIEQLETQGLTLPPTVLS